LQAFGVVGKNEKKNRGKLLPSPFFACLYYAESPRETRINLIPRFSKGGRGESLGTRLEYSQSGFQATETLVQGY